MRKEKKDSVQFALRLDRTIANDLEKMSVATGLTKTKITERALAEYIRKYNEVGWGFKDK